MLSVEYVKASLFWTKSLLLICILLIPLPLPSCEKDECRILKALPFVLLQGDIASCAGSYLHLWTVNGQPLVSVNTTCSPKSCIACCCFAEVMDWDTRSIVITGSTDGVVRVGGRGWEKGILIQCRCEWRDRATRSPCHLLNRTAQGIKLKTGVKDFLLISFVLLNERYLLFGKSFENTLFTLGCFQKQKCYCPSEICLCFLEKQFLAGKM